MRYFPHTADDVADMLQTVGAASLEDLFAPVPGDCRRIRPLDLPEPLTEWDLEETLDDLGRGMATAPEFSLYVGAGSYEHRIPAALLHLLSRSEFVTSYTPYQPEMSQGTLQAIYEYQSLTARLLGLEVANASLYDGATALAEALLMAVRITGRGRVVLSRVIHPHYRQVVRTYLEPAGLEILELPYDEQGGTDLSGLSEQKDVAAVALQSPNFFGCMEDLPAAAKTVQGMGALLVAVFTEPLAYGLYRNPGQCGAHLACGEGQSLGIAPSFGGPGLGMFATRKQYVRQMPGRVVGKTTDRQGRRGFVLTLATREQHIRREKATSNICTNSSLCALAAVMYMSLLGAGGFRDLARLNYDKAMYLRGALQRAGCGVPFARPVFNEFVVALPGEPGAVHARLREKKILAGLPLDPYYPELAGHVLMCVTETKSRAELDRLVQEIET